MHGRGHKGSPVFTSKNWKKWAKNKGGDQVRENSVNGRRDDLKISIRAKRGWCDKVYNLLDTGALHPRNV